jgi:hypothetical protein
LLAEIIAPYLNLCNPSFDRYPQGLASLVFLANKNDSHNTELHFSGSISSSSSKSSAIISIIFFIIGILKNIIVILLVLNSNYQVKREFPEGMAGGKAAAFGKSRRG